MSSNYATGQILPGVYGVRDYTVGTPLGAIGNALITVLGRGDKKLESPKLLGYYVTPCTKDGGYVAAQAAQFYKVTAYNDLGETTQEDVIEVPAFTGTAAAPLSVVIKWATVPGATGYKVYRSATKTAWTDTLIADIVGSASQLEDNKITATTGTIPVSTTALIVDYNKPVLYTDMGTLKANHGWDTSLGLAAEIAVRQGLSRLMVISVDYTQADAADADTEHTAQEKAAAKSAALAIAYQNALKAAEGIETDGIVLLETDDAVLAKLTAHLTKMNGSKLQRNRMASYSTGTSSELADVVAFAKDLNNNRLWVTAPNTAYISYEGEDGVVKSNVQLGGEFVAFASMVQKVMVGDAATSIAEAEMQVFDKLGKDYEEEERETLKVAGVTAYYGLNNGYTQVCSDDCTTCKDSVEQASLAIMWADVWIGKQVKAICEPFKCKKPTTAYMKALNTAVTDGLTKYEGTIITKLIRPVTTTRSADNPEKVLVKFRYQPMYTAKILEIEWGFSTQVS